MKRFVSGEAVPCISDHQTGSNTNRLSGDGFDSCFSLVSDSSANDFLSANESRISHIELKPGLSLSLIDLKSETDAIVSYKIDEPMIGFGCILSGDIKNQRHTLEETSFSAAGPAGTGGVSFFLKSEGTIRKLSGQSVKILHVHVTPETMKSMFGSEISSLPQPLKTVFKEKHQRPFSFKQNMSSNAKSVAHQIANGTPHGVPEKVYLEGKALELISLQIASLKSGQEQTAESANLTHAEREKILTIGKTLVENLDSPPSLKSTARSVGLSVNKLESGFKKVYGMPVFSFIRECKMQKAKLLFLETSLNVSEVAWEVGYVNVSHFGAAFKKRFGILPKQFLKKNGRV